MSEPVSTSGRLSGYQIKQIVLLAFAALLLAGFFYYRWRAVREPADLRVEAGRTGRLVRVQMKGAVGKPGVYEAPLGSNVADLLRMSDSKVKLEDLPAHWRNIPLFDGMLVEVWIASDGKPQLSANMMNGKTLGLLFINLDLNEASAKDLESLPGIGPSTAEAIVAYRTEHGPFGTVEDLKQVKGIGDKTIESLRFRVAVGGSRPVEQAK